jgi:hypothetical protein
MGGARAEHRGDGDAAGERDIAPDRAADDADGKRLARPQPVAFAGRHRPAVDADVAQASGHGEAQRPRRLETAAQAGELQRRRVGFVAAQRVGERHRGHVDRPGGRYPEMTKAEAAGVLHAQHRPG